MWQTIYDCSAVLLNVHLCVLSCSVAKGSLCTGVYLGGSGLWLQAAAVQVELGNNLKQDWMNRKNKYLWTAVARVNVNVTVL